LGTYQDEVHGRVARALDLRPRELLVLGLVLLALRLDILLELRVLRLELRDQAVLVDGDDALVIRDLLLQRRDLKMNVLCKR
jgi:hypothetical protein